MYFLMFWSVLFCVGRLQCHVISIAWFALLCYVYDFVACWQANMKSKEEYRLQISNLIGKDERDSWIFSYIMHRVAKYERNNITQQRKRHIEIQNGIICFIFSSHTPILPFCTFCISPPSIVTDWCYVETLN